MMQRPVPGRGGPRGVDKTDHDSQHQNEPTTKVIGDPMLAHRKGEFDIDESETTLVKAKHENQRTCLPIEERCDRRRGESAKGSLQ